MVGTPSSEGKPSEAMAGIGKQQYTILLDKRFNNNFQENVKFHGFVKKNTVLPLNQTNCCQEKKRVDIFERNMSKKLTGNSHLVSRCIELSKLATMPKTNGNKKCPHKIRN